MNKFFLKAFFLLSLLAGSSSVYAATDSYRWLHVTIETPWAIFLFLLPMVLLPAILMAFLYWKYLNKKPDEDKAVKAAPEEKKE